MNIKWVFCIASVVCLLVLAPVPAQTAGPPPQKQSLTMPATVAPPPGQPAPSIECVVTFGPSVPASALAFSPDGKTLAVGGYQEVLLWDLASGKLSKRVGVGQITSFVHALAFGKDGRSLVVAEGTPHRSGAVRVLDVETGRQSSSFEEPKDVVYSVASSPDGKLLAASGADGLAHIWSMEEKKLVATIQGHSDWVLGVSFSPDGKFLATASADNSSQVWEVGSWNSVRKLPQSDTVHGAAFSADGTLLALAVGGPKDRAIRIRRRDNAQQTRAIGLGTTTPLDVIWAPKGNKLYVPCSDNTLKVYNAANGALIANLSGHEDWVYCAAVNADETRFASGSADGVVKLWNGADNKLLATFLQLTPRTDEWLVMTAQGYLATSTPGALEWKTTNVPAPDKLTSLYQNPESVRKSIAGEAVAPPALQ
ncbi:MAG: WD40 repeat domain-containing protein [Pirellulaceae bacterium]